MKNYVATIGIETHVQLSTKTKLFAAVDNDARTADPNMLTSPICFGMPGVLPVLNSKVIKLAIRAGIALNAEIAEFSKFDRKHYFYPDLPKGYQITQFDQPTVGKGSVEINVGGESKTIGITRAHIEEDAGKSTHPSGKDYSLVDLNRAGTPLLEIVSEPEISSPQEAKAYVQEVYYLMKYAAVSNVDLYHGNMRFDVNVSIAESGADNLGTRSETKNLNSFKSVEKAAEYEINRQIEELEKGKEIVQETRGWDDSKMKTFSQRGKEDAHDYRYFPDPDLPPVVIKKSDIEKIRKNMPILPHEIRSKLHEAGLSNEQVSIILANSDYVKIMLTALDELTDKKKIIKISNWITTNVQGYMAKNPSTDSHLHFSQLEQLVDMTFSDQLSSSNAKVVLKELINHGGSPRKIAEELNLIQVSDSSEIDPIVDKVIEDNPKAANDVKSGEHKAIGFLVGQVMKASKGKANPKMVTEAIKRKVDELES